jgi:Cation transporter/ATPase, N-terminus
VPSSAQFQQIQLTAGDLYDKEKVDLETVEVGDVLQLLQCDEGGLTSAEAERRLGIFGPNKLEEKLQNPILQVRLAPLLKHWSASNVFPSVAVLKLHVEPSVVGHGNGCRRGDHPI